jgi:transcriptional regulator with XRE-family HTH domain
MEMFDTQGLKRLIAEKTGTQTKLAEISGMHIVRLNNIVQGHILPNTGEIDTLKAILGPEVLSFFDNFDALSSVEEAESTLKKLQQELVEAEVQGENTNYIKARINKVEQKLKVLRQAQEREAQEAQKREMHTKATLANKRNQEAIKSHLTGKISALKTFSELIKKFNNNLGDMLEKAQEEENGLTAKIDELASQIPPDQADNNLSDKYNQLNKVRKLIEKHTNELAALRNEYTRAEVTNGSSEKLAELKKESDHLFAVLENLKVYEQNLVTSIELLESEGFKAQQATLSLEAKTLEGKAEMLRALQKSLNELLHRTNSLWADIETHAEALNKKFAQARGKGKLIDTENIIPKIALDQQVCADVANWLFNPVEELIRQMSQRKGISDMLLLNLSLKNLLGLAKRYRV